jgi:hypothetical protein
METFSIAALPDRDGMGEIVIGAFRERFSLDQSDWSSADYVASWRSAVAELLAGAPAVALMTSSARPETELVRRAWTLYRQAETIFVQDRLFVPADHAFALDTTGRVVDLAPRETMSETGEPISQWETTVEALSDFLRRTAVD